MKRVKKGYERHGEVRLYERAGALCIEQLRNSIERHTVVLSARECEALGMTAVLEDVPEPWERLRDALHHAAREFGRTPAHPAYQIPSDVLVRAAALLGIKPEGES